MTINDIKDLFQLRPSPFTKQQEALLSRIRIADALNKNSQDPWRAMRRLINVGNPQGLLFTPPTILCGMAGLMAMIGDDNRHIHPEAAMVLFVLYDNMDVVSLWLPSFLRLANRHFDESDEDLTAEVLLTKFFPNGIPDQKECEYYAAQAVKAGYLFNDLLVDPDMQALANSLLEKLKILDEKSSLTKSEVK